MSSRDLLQKFKPVAGEVVRILHQAILRRLVLPVVAPLSITQEFTWPILAFTKYHTVLRVVTLKRTCDVHSVLVACWLSCSVDFTISAGSPSNQTLQLSHLVGSYPDRILKDSPMVGIIAWRNSLCAFITEIIFCSNLEEPLIWPP